VPPSLSIVIPSHNRVDLLRACLTTVLRHAPQAEVLVVDDGSPRSVVSEAASKAGVRAIRLDRRRGFSVAVNRGIAEAHGEVVELLNDDTEVSAGWAEAAVRHFDDPTVGAVAPLVLRWPHGDRIDSAGDRYYLGGVAGKRGHDQPLSEEFLHPCGVFGASGSSGFFRTTALRRLGGLAESFGAYFEDVDLAFRLHWAGFQVVFEPAARVLHHVSASHGRPRRRLLEQQSRNEELVFWRNLPAASLPRAIPHHLAVLAGKALLRWQDGGLVPFLTGRLRAAGAAGAVLRYRRRLASEHASQDTDHWLVERRLWDTARSR
jgi:GT2 family glycosyltransferase